MLRQNKIVSTRLIFFIGNLHLCVEKLQLFAPTRFYKPHRRAFW